MHPKIRGRWAKMGRIGVERTPIGLRRYHRAKRHSPDLHQGSPVRKDRIVRRGSGLVLPLCRHFGTGVTRPCSSTGASDEREAVTLELRSFHGVTESVWAGCTGTMLAARTRESQSQTTTIDMHADAAMRVDLRPIHVPKAPPARAPRAVSAPSTS